MNWNELINIPKWLPINQLDFTLLKLEEDIYKISETQYCLTAPYNSLSLKEIPGGPYLTALVWACSEGAARRAYLNDIESDERVQINPPEEILPKRGAKTYREILKELRQRGYKTVIESAGYRIMSDGAFIHRVIETRMASYFFRSPKNNSDEIPYAIQWNLIESK